MQKDIVCASGRIDVHASAKLLICRHKKTGQGPVSFGRGCVGYLGWAKQLRRLTGLRALQVTQGFTHHLLGQARALAALAADAEAFAHVAVAAAPFVNGVADVAVGDTLAEADIHGLGFAAGCD